MDASKIDIRSFEPGLADSPEEMDSLLVHLYFLAAKFLPTLTKNWWIDSENRVKGPVETWTQKYVSVVLLEIYLISSMLTYPRYLPLSPKSL